MKRFFSILLVAILVVTTLSTVAAAKEVKAGSTVDIDVTVSGEFANYLIDIKADAGLTIKKISGASAYVINSATSAKANWAAADNVESHTVTVTVEVANNLSCAQSYKVTATAQRASKTIPMDQDTDGILDGVTATTVTVTGGTITVSHTPGAWEVTDATCTEAGKKVQKCTVCGEDLKTETIPAKGHTAGTWTVTKEATCTEAGEKKLTCSVCGDVIKTETIPAKGHTEGTWTVTKEATCTEAGEKELTCSVCGDVIKTETIPAKGHTAGTWTVTKEATCTEAGSKEQKCSVCGELLKTETIAALGHDLENLEEIERVDATCTVDGYVKYKCPRCDKYVKTETIAALGHDYVKTAGTATCTEPGWVTWTCTRCGDSYTEMDSPALEHDYKLVESKEATCEEDGFEKYECSRCGDAYTNKLNALGHQWCEDFDCGIDHEHFNEEYHWFLCMRAGCKNAVERHDHCIEVNGYLYCKCGHWIEIDDPGIDPEPKPGDYSFVMYAGIAALIAMMAAAYYVYKRKMAN